MGENKIFNVTIVVPTYNSGLTLERALESVANQTVQARETIVVDDGSSPRELQLTFEIISRYPNTRLLVQDRNGGPSRARNVGWEASTTPWVAFLDSDDAWHPRKLEFQSYVVSIAKQPPVIIGTQRIVHDGLEEKLSTDTTSSLRISSISKRDLIWRNQFATSSVIVQRDIPHRFRDGKNYSEDFELWLMISGLEMPMLRIDSGLTIAFKPAVGHSGLSAATWKMTRGSYDSYLMGYRTGVIGLPGLSAAFASVTVRAAFRHLKIFLGKIVKSSRQQKNYSEPNISTQNLGV